MAEIDTLGFKPIETEDTLGFVSSEDEVIPGISDIKGGVNVGIQTSPTRNVEDVANQQFTVSTQQDRDRWALDGKVGWWEYARRSKGKDNYYGDIRELAILKN